MLLVLKRFSEARRAYDNCKKMSFLELCKCRNHGKYILIPFKVSFRGNKKSNSGSIYGFSIVLRVYERFSIC